MTNENRDYVTKIYTDIGKEYKANIKKTYRNRKIATGLVYGVIGLASIITFFFNKNAFLLIAFFIFLVLIVLDFRNSDKQKAKELDTSDIELGQEHYLDNKKVVGHNNKVFKYYFKNVGLIALCLVILGAVCIFTYFSIIKEDNYDEYIDVSGTLRYVDYDVDKLYIGLNDNTVEYRLDETYVSSIDSDILDKVNVGDNVILKVSNKTNNTYSGTHEGISEYNYFYYLQIGDNIYLDHDTYLKVNKQNQLIRLIIGLVCFLIALILALYLSILKIYTNRLKKYEKIDVNKYLDKK